MRKNQNLFERLASVQALDTEAIPRQPLVEIFGNTRVLIENHHGVLSYCVTEICVKVHLGTICITGCDLQLARMAKEQLVIIGKIASVMLCEGRHG